MMDRQEVFKRLNEIFQDVFDDEELVVTDETCADDVEDWDSLRHITLISTVEKAFGMKFAMKEVLEMENVGAMADILVERATK
jgi:acyl carrier protein